MNFINLTVQYYLYLLLFALMYKLVFIFRLFNKYMHISGSNPVVLLGYTSFLHSAGVGFLYYSLYYDTRFYLVFLVLNGMWMGAVVIGFLLGITDVVAMERLRDDPLNHMLLGVAFTLAAALEVLVYLHKNTRIASREPELVHKEDDKKPRVSIKLKPKSKEGNVAVLSKTSNTGIEDKPHTPTDDIIVTEGK